MRKFVDYFFGCSHRRTSFPITPIAKRMIAGRAIPSRTYTVCLTCGQEFAYDWENMRINRTVAANREQAADRMTVTQLYEV
jgi:hypothetical protein